MKIYSVQFSCKTPSEQRFWTTQYSNIAIGIKVEDAPIGATLVLKDQTGLTLTPEADKIGGFTIYKVNTQGEGSTQYTLTVGNQKFKLTQIVTGSSVFEKDNDTPIPTDLSVDGLSVNTMETNSLTTNGLSAINASVRTITSPGNLEESGANVSVTATTGDIVLSAADDVSLEASGDIAFKSSNDTFTFENGSGDVLSTDVATLSAALNGGGGGGDEDLPIVNLTDWNGNSNVTLSANTCYYVYADYGTHIIVLPSASTKWKIELCIDQTLDASSGLYEIRVGYGLDRMFGAWSGGDQQGGSDDSQFHFDSASCPYFNIVSDGHGHIKVMAFGKPDFS